MSVIQEDQDDQDRVETKADREHQDRLDHQAPLDPQDSPVFQDQLDCPVDQDLQVTQVLMALLEFLVDTLVSISPSKLFHFIVM